MTTLLDEALRALRNCLRVIDYDGALDADPQRVAIEAHAVLARADAQRDEAQGVTDAYDGFYRSGQDLPALHDDPLINLELQVQALCARLDTARAVCAQAAAMQVVTPALQRIKDNAVWAMRETAPGRVMPRSFAALEAVSPMLAKVPDGYVIVPKEPTQHMLDEVYKGNPLVGPPEMLTEDRARQHRERHERNLRANWRIMLAAAKEDSHGR